MEEGVLEDSATQGQSKIVELTKANEVLQAELERTKTKLLKYKRLSDENQKKVSLVTQQLSTARTELENLLKEKQQVETDRYQNESRHCSHSPQLTDYHSRLKRIEEELDRYRASLKEAKSTDKEKESGTLSRKDIEKILVENKKLEKQRNELLFAFKKQMKLIDILKRQRIHMEAAKQLSINEGEFSLH